MNEIRYITIERGEDFNSSISKLSRYLGSLNQYNVYDKPETLMGTFKILKLRRTQNINSVSVKIDGPGFIIDQLFDFFTKEIDRGKT